MRKKLGVNIDHVSTLRQARMVDYPDPLFAAAIAELAGADGITVHLREDRRHIQDRDIYLLRNAIKTGMNLEMALNPEILDIALKVIPDDVCLVPERREEITTEGGLDVLRHEKELSDFIPRLHGKGIHVSLFIDPEIKQVEAAARLKADAVELHTGRYANARGAQDTGAETARIMESVKAGRGLGLIVNAGHGLNYQNVYRIARLEGIDTLNIGHSIIAQAIFVGLDRAVRDMIAILDRAHIDTLAR